MTCWRDEEEAAVNARVGDLYRPVDSLLIREVVVEARFDVINNRLPTASSNVSV